MTKEELAVLLNNSEYPLTIPKDIRKAAKENNLVIVYGASDDLMEFDGAIRDEVGCYEGGTFMIDKNGPLSSWGDIDHDSEKACREYFKRKDAATCKIEALWGDEPNYSWTYKTTIPHATFEIVEDGEPYCRGIVFNLDDLG